MDGILVIDKPAGPTSHDVVQMVKRTISAKKVGHLGTLDPQATGVLPLCINGATKKASSLSGGEKVYEFTLVLGARTDTDDDQGRVIEWHAVGACEVERVDELLNEFVGDIDQVPPAYSACKVGGKRMYKMARRGEDVPRGPRRVTVYELTVLHSESTSVRMRMRCGKGTYVRALCRDIGERLGCGGHAADIRRIQSGRFTLDHAVTLDEVEDHWKERMIPLT